MATFSSWGKKGVGLEGDPCLSVGLLGVSLEHSGCLVYVPDPDWIELPADGRSDGSAVQLLAPRCLKQ